MTQRESMPMWLGTMSLEQADAACPRTLAQVRERALAAEIVGDAVVVERVRRRDGVGVAAHPLDPLRGGRALPQADQPQPGDAPARRACPAPRRGSRRASGCRGRTAATAGRARRRCSWRSARAAASRPSRRRTPRVRRRGRGTRADGRSVRRSPPPNRMWSARSSSAMIPSAMSSRPINASRSAPSSLPQRSRT